MKKFLVPTDFSDTSKNAAIYAVNMLAGKRDVQIILYNLYDPIVAGSDGTPLAGDDADRQVILHQALENLKSDMTSISPVSIKTVAEPGTSLIESLDRYVRHTGVDMVIMGITGSTKLGQIFMGSNTVRMAKEGVCPVLIIPPDAKYKELKEVAITSDFKDVDTTTPFAPIKSFLNMFNPTLYIINVDSDHYVEISEEYKAERNKLEKHFGKYKPQFAFIRLFDFLEAINQFAEDKGIDMIITIPRQHSFLGGLFKSSTTKKLAYHSNVPILAIQE